MKLKMMDRLVRGVLVHILAAMLVLSISNKGWAAPILLDMQVGEVRVLAIL